MKLSKYCVIYPDLDDPESVILFSTKRASSVLIDKSTLAGIESGTLDEEDTYTLTDLGFLVKSEQEERDEILRFIDDLNSKDPGFSIILVMNLDCNLACPYCFEGTKRGRHYMSHETADNIIAFAEKQFAKGKNELRVDFYGGEPLLSVDLIENMARRFGDIAGKYNGQFAFSLTTNGTLLNAQVVRRLKPIGLKSAAITIDGPEEYHNTSRPFATGTGSFSRIIENIKEVCDDITIYLGGNYREDNYREFPGLLDYLLEQGLTPDRIGSIEFAPVVREREGIVLPDFVGGCANMYAPWLLDAMFFLRKEIVERNFPTQKISPSLCAVDRKSAFIVNYDGGIYKCPSVIGEPEFRVGDVVNGVVDYSVSHGMNNWKSDKCLDCVYLPLCFGGCRYISFLTNGEFTGLDCQKHFYDASFEKYVRQDLEMSRRQSS